ncbi:programmed cell death protein 10-like isoform X1 [Amphiura filiformis]|uniref:programmed cell death protein 10-like isoform X1 n=1 Tax=Amphiura filiformis TaxID=82378 RepID=UPI003B216616
MTMDGEDGSTVVSLPLHIILFPILDELQHTDLSAAQTLRAAFSKVEQKNPGFSQDFVNGILKNKSPSVDLTESLLKLAAYDSEEYRITLARARVPQLNEQARRLKLILARLPDEANDRPQFLQTIKDIASAIKDLLEAVNVVFKNNEAFRRPEHKRPFHKRKSAFFTSSKLFSESLKKYFKDGNIRHVYSCALQLVRDTNAILVLLKAIM